MTGDDQGSERLGQTPWQTVGPFFHYGLPWKGGADLIGASDLGARPDLTAPEHFLLNGPIRRGEVAGQAVEIIGQVFDGAGAPVPDAMIEVWQANAAGRYNSPDDLREDVPLDAAFAGFGRSAATPDGAYRFRTIAPGRTPGPGNSLQAPHIAIGIFGRGLIKRLVTRLYFEDGAGNDEDAVLALVPPTRRATLIAGKISAVPLTYRFDIHLQGDHETVFFDV
jgi:protocatechuate 3,4-dioxygenase alpha subunit